MHVEGTGGNTVNGFGGQGNETACRKSARGFLHYLARIVGSFPIKDLRRAACRCHGIMQYIENFRRLQKGRAFCSSRTGWCGKKMYSIAQTDKRQGNRQSLHRCRERLPLRFQAHLEVGDRLAVLVDEAKTTRPIHLL